MHFLRDPDSAESAGASSREATSRSTFRPRPSAASCVRSLRPMVRTGRSASTRMRRYTPACSTGAERAELPIAADRQVYLHVARGKVTANGNVLNAGDALALTDTSALTLARWSGRRGDSVRSAASCWSAAVTIELMIPARRKDLGGFEVGRVCPLDQAAHGRTVYFSSTTGPSELSAQLAAQDRCEAASSHRRCLRSLFVRWRDRAPG